MALRGHDAIVLDNLKGLWQRGDPDDTPQDHMQDCSNIMFVDNNFVTRPGIALNQNVLVPLGNVRRMYNYATQTANTLLVLTYDGTTGKIYHVVNSTTIYEILSIVGMTDFAFVGYAGRAYISPFTSFTTGALNIQKGMQSQYLYVYEGAGVVARVAAGAGPSGSLTVAAGAAGNTDPGFKVFAVVYEYSTGYLSPPGAFKTFTCIATNSVSFGTVPVSGSSYVTKRHIVATKTITSYNGNPEGYQFFFIPNGTINDNVSVALNNISFFDADLLEDASHLIDNYTSIPAGAALSIYHDRLCLSTTYSDISIVLVSAPGEPEAINQLDGVIVVPLDGNPITNHQELRDIFYVYKRARTVAYIDNGDEPSSWPLTVIDNALGTSVHGIATVLDSGASSVDFLIVATYAGIMLFNGRYVIPELSWKIADFWGQQERDEYRHIQIVNAPIEKRIYIVCPDGRILVGDYSRGFDPKNIRWTPWVFDVFINCVAIVNIDEIVIGADIAP